MKLAKGLTEAKKTVNEMGFHKVHVVYRYTTIEGIGEQYAVFTVEEIVDIFQPSYVVDPVIVYTLLGGWIDES